MAFVPVRLHARHEQYAATSGALTALTRPENGSARRQRSARASRSYATSSAAAALRSKRAARRRALASPSVGGAACFRATPK